MNRWDISAPGSAPPSSPLEEKNPADPKAQDHGSCDGTAITHVDDNSDDEESYCIIDDSDAKEEYCIVKVGNHAEIAMH